MSAPAIEARSLSSLTALASNPPSYPRNPTHLKHDPLVLYIARVPGSRDVFLTPMKPRDRVVTAEDIQSSLYFVHVENPEDTRLIEPPPHFEQPRYGGEHPLPDLPQEAAIPRKAVGGHPAAPGMPTAPKRKPLPGTLAPINNFESRQNISAGNHTQPSSGLLAPDYTPRRSFDSIQRSENTRPSLPPRMSAEQARPSSTTLTVIRRDPVSGVQWNVARVEDQPALDFASYTLNESPSKKKTGAPVHIEVTNPGYSKFLHTEQISTSSLRSSGGNPAITTPEEHGGAGSATFRRRVWMEGPRYTNNGVGHRRLNSHDSNVSGGSPRGSLDWQRETSSTDIRAQGYPAQPSRDNQGLDRQSNFRGYVFMSPWNGRCEFITGTAGASLRCRHLIPGLQGTPPVAMPVSELRFNLPSSSRASTPRGEESSKRSSFFHRPRNNRHGSSYDSRASHAEDVRNSFERMDLSLGQEFAGGGFGGRQAKLGKLIIEDEGLKMVDLLVAANLALWWRAYERTDTRSKDGRGSF